MRYRRKHKRLRPRGWFSLFIRMGGWVCLVSGLFLVALTVFSASALYLGDRMDAEGRYARAVVEDKREVVTQDSEGDDDHSYYVLFVYKTSNGLLRTEATVNFGYYEGIETGDSTVIRYLRDDPSHIEYEPGSYHRNGRLLRTIGLVVGLIGLATLWRFGSETNRAIKARRDGDKRFAVITSIEDAGIKINGKPQARLVWREEDGQVGESLMHSIYTLRDLYEASERIVVFRLGEDAVWEGDVGPPKREMRLG
jgi:hypothetical protein